MSYPLSNDLRHAIVTLFDDPTVAYGPLGVHDTDVNELRMASYSARISPIDRASSLRKEIETYILQMAKEHEELGSPESSETLRMQAVGLLIALRELVRHFPELEDR